MIRGLLATTATLSILTVSAIIGLEAVGLLFQGSQQEPTIASIQPLDPEESAAALFLQRQEKEDLAQPRRQAEQERREAEQHEAGRQAQDEERKIADAHRWAERRRRESERQLAALEPKQEVASLTDAPGQAERNPPQQAAPEPKLAGPQPHPAIESLGGADAPRSPAQSQPVVCAGICQAKSSVQRPPAAHRLSVDRAKSNLARVASAGNPACPLLGWLQAAMAQPNAAAASRTAARRRAT